MKITYEFDTSSEDWQDDKYIRERYEASFDMLMALSDIKDQVREWNKYDTRESIPTSEIFDTIYDIINNRVPKLEEMIY